MMMTEDQAEAMKHAGDAAAVVVTVGTLASILPAVASLFSIVWLAIRIWETKTVQGFLAYMRGD